MGFASSTTCDTAAESYNVHWIAVGVTIAFAVYVLLDVVLGAWVVARKVEAASALRRAPGV